MAYEYQFPQMKKIRKFTVGSQICKILDEVNELEIATNIEDICIEAFDVIHACETLLRIADSPDKVESYYHATIAKNEERGYYNER